MRRVLRQDPDVILIGEMRDEETVRTALSAAETGHLVLSTVHTLDAAESVNRIIDFFQPHEQSQARAMLAGTLRAVVSQRLVRDRRPYGRVAVCEILRMTGRARDMILDPDQTDRLREVIAEGEYYGMQTFDQALLSHYRRAGCRWRTRSASARARTTSSCWSPARAHADLDGRPHRSGDLARVLEPEPVAQDAPAAPPPCNAGAPETAPVQHAEAAGQPTAPWLR